MDSIMTFAREFWMIFGEMSPWLLLGFAVAGVMSVIIPPHSVETHLGGKGAGPILKASAFGVPLPLCSCGVIPVAASLRRHGASKGATTAFLISTPQTGVDSIAVTYSLLGPVYAIVRPIVAFISGILGGVFVDEAAGAEDGDEDLTCTDACCSDVGKTMSWWKRMLHHGFVALPADIGPMLFVGIIIAAAITLLVPEDFFATEVGGVMGGSILGMVIMMLLGIPMYVCATASVPIAASLIAKGISPGTALVFLMTGPASNAASLAIIAKVMGRRAALCYLTAVGAVALGSGVALDAVNRYLGNPIERQVMKTETMEMMPAWLGTAFAVALILVIIVAVVLNRRSGHGHDHEDHDHGNEHEHATDGSCCHTTTDHCCEHKDQ
jgi:uncharacterized membrane protein YraQ (UPF0718 family)